MSKPQHPYPLPVRVAVAETIAKQVLVMREWADLTAQTRKAFLKDADQVLHTLWDASRIDWVDEVDNLPDDALIRHSDGMTELGEYFKLERTFADHPAHVLYWGESDA